MDFIYYIFKDFVYFSAIILLLLIVSASIAAIVKPGLMPNRLKMFSSRKNTAIGSLVSVLLLGGLIGIIGPSSMEQLHREKELAKQLQEADKNEEAKQETFWANSQYPIEKKILKITRTIPYEKHEKENRALAPGKKEITQKGVDGKKILTYEVAYRNGKEVSRILKSEVISLKPLAQITSIGASKTNKNTSLRGGPERPERHCKSFLSSWFANLYGSKCSSRGN